jgi:ABC-type multidrug transport system ATPase subunit
MFFSSHHLFEVELIADHIGIINLGKMVACGVLDEMKARYRRLQLVFEGSVELPPCWPDGVESVRQEDA